MHTESRHGELLTQGRWEARDTRVNTVSRSYRGGQPKRTRSGLSRLQPTVVENKNVTGQLSTFFHHLAGQDLDGDNTGR